MLRFGHVFCQHGSTVFIHKSHVQFGDPYQLTGCGHQLIHLYDMFFLAGLSSRIHMVRDMHLCAYTVNNCQTVCFPLFNPLNQALQLLVVVPVRFQIIIVDKQLHICRTMGAGQFHCRTYVVLTQIILPVEVVLGICFRYIACRLKVIEAVAVTICTGEWFIHHIPGQYIPFSCFHHTCNPGIHRPCECIGLLFRCLRHLVSRFFDLPYNVIEIVSVGFTKYREIESDGAHSFLCACNCACVGVFLPFSCKAGATHHGIVEISTWLCMCLGFSCGGFFRTDLHTEAISFTGGEHIGNLHKELCIPGIHRIIT